MSEQLDRLRDIVARLRAPGGCPWDREQTHATLRSSVIEEAYEVAEAIDRADAAHLREELGDLLLQVVMHAQIAEEQGSFGFEEIARAIARKMIRRHPHVFGENQTLASSDAVLAQWDEIKRRERADKSAGSEAPDSLLGGVSAALPALMRAEKIQKRAARAGFDWDNLHSVVEKIREETGEVEAEIASGHTGRLGEELGDLLFSVVNLARKAGCDAELLLTRATEKFTARFQKLEAEIARRGLRFENLTLADMDAVWEEIKAEAAGSPPPP